MSTCGGGLGFSLGPGAGVELIDERMQDSILSDITRGIFEQTLVIFGMIKEGLMEIMQECLFTYRIGIMVLLDERLGAF